MNDTVRVNVGPIDQDVIELCPVIETFNDGVIEGTEYFTVSLRPPEGPDLASCQVAIIDTDSGKIQAIILIFFLCITMDTPLQIHLCLCSCV